MDGIADIEVFLKKLMLGEFSSLTLSFNERSAPCYQTVWQRVCEDPSEYRWVSEAERDAAMRSNSCWTLHWYPDTPVGFCEVSASSLAALVDYVKREA